jgi:hypothetical protein
LLAWLLALLSAGPFDSVRNKSTAATDDSCAHLITLVHFFGLLRGRFALCGGFRALLWGGLLRRGLLFFRTLCVHQYIPEGSQE